MIGSHNYVNIQGFMVSDLHLKGNELLIYAVIFGFSQEENSWFTGSLAYLEEWTQSSKQGVINSLRTLIEKHLIEKREEMIEGRKYCKYRVVCNYSDGQLSGPARSTEWTASGQLSGPNNIIDNIDNNNKSLESQCKDLLQQLNEQSGFKYRNVRTNLKLIASRLKDYTYDELSRMITYMCSLWSTSDKMRPYLRPSTLFRASNCENYVVASQQPQVDEQYNVQQRCYLDKLVIEQYERENYGD